MARWSVSDLLVHNFPENGVKFLLHNPGNLHEMMQMLAARYTTLPDPRCFKFARRTIEPDTQIRGDFSHGITDLLLRLPFCEDNRPNEWIKLYLRFEHLSAHERHIVPRSVGYAMDVYRLQERRWQEQKKSDTLHGFMYEAVIPIVFYTGDRTWHQPTPFQDLVQGGARFAEFIPSNKPLFLSLPAQSEQDLLETGGVFGSVLHVLQQRHASYELFRGMLKNAARRVETAAFRPGQASATRSVVVSVLFGVSFQR